MSTRMLVVGQSAGLLRKASSAFVALSMVAFSFLPVVTIVAQPATVEAATTSNLTPNGIGNYDNWNVNSGTKTAAVAADDGDTTYIYSNTTGQRQSFTFPGAGISPNALINSVTVYAVAKEPGSGSDIKFLVEKGTGGGQQSVGSSENLSSNYTLESRTMTTNPFTGLAWTAAEANAWTVRFGVEQDDSDTSRITQFYVVVDYATPAIQIDTVNGLPPASITCDNPTNTLELTLAGSGSSEAPPGDASQYRVQIDWGDGNVTNNLGTFTPNSGHVVFSFTYSGLHTYSTQGTYTLKARLYHQGAPGNDNQADAVSSVQICVTPPVTTGGLVVTKVITNDNGGTTATSSFSFTIPGVNSGNPTAFEVDGTNEFTLTEGAYTVTEVANSGYTTSYSAGCTAGVTAGATTTCTVTNNDKQGTLSVKKVLVKDNGGTLNAENFSFAVNGTATTTFDEVDGQNDISVNAGTYTVTEESVAGWNTTYDNCSGVAVSSGETEICTITNNDLPSSITVTKIVNNTYRGTSLIADFLLYVGITPVLSRVLTSPFNVGTYDVTEQGPTGYNAVFEGDCVGGSITVGLGETKDCTITNTDKEPGTLHIIKVVENDNADEFKGIATADDFTLSVTGGNPDPGSVLGTGAPGADVIIDAGAAYSVSETGGPTGEYGVSYSEGCSGVMSEGGEATCTVTNNDNSPTEGYVTVIKSVVNDNGGDATLSAWTLQVIDDSEVVTGVTNGAATLFPPGNYSINETGGPAGYAKTSTMCATDGGTALPTNSIDIVEGHSYVCTITNDDIAPSLTLTKVVENNNGGTAVAADWALGASGPSLISGAGGVVSGATLQAGAYTLSEIGGPSGYEAGSWSCQGDVENVDNTVTLGIGQSATCSITNTDLPGTIHVLKTVINNNGGSAVASDFYFQVNGREETPFVGGGSEGSKDVSVPAGTYTITEVEPNGYVRSYDNCTEIAVVNGGEATCTITNDDTPAVLTIVKNTTLADGTFEFTVVGGNDFSTSTQVVTSGNTGSIDVGLNAGTYNVSEIVPGGWNLSDASCDNEDSVSEVSIALNSHVTCTFYNTRLTGSLVVKKVVVNENAGTATSSDFQMHVKQNDVHVSGSPATGTPNGTTYESLLTGTYSVSETGPAGYAALYSGDCDAQGNVVVSDDETATCVVTNTDTSLPQCSDGLDNDGDGLKDNQDPGCYPNQNPGDTQSYNPNDNDETHVPETVTPPSGGGGGGGNGPIAVSTPVGQVLGVAIEVIEDCTKYLTSYIRSGRANDTAQVIRLQNFLNSLEGFNLTVSGVYDAPSLSAVNAFQVKYMSDILTPWGATGPTGYVYYTTQKKVNEIYCRFTKQFPLTSEQLAEIARIKALGEAFTPATPATPAVPTVTPAVPATPAAPSAPADDTQEVGSAGDDSTASAAEAEEGSGFFGSIIKWLFGN